VLRSGFRLPSTNRLPTEIFCQQYSKMNNSSMRYWLASRIWVPTEINSALYSNMYPYSLSSLIHFKAFFAHCGYALTRIVIILILQIKSTFVKLQGWDLARGLCPLLRVMKFKNTRILTKTKTFYLQGQRLMNVNNTTFAWQ